MKKYALLGEKLSHSYSPLIHNEIFKDLNIDASYELIELKIEDLKPQLEKLKSLEYSGYNVTIPYKSQIIPMPILLDFLEITIMKKLGNH